ncbi:anthranilate phosphoribosyltransferase [Leeia sp. TBRC 13508]|uniref:Anthranilate phosphoribosyltransferase n=1 Tax=Leeia speluncae TaxID=2884804 RepID=A0ABS8D1U4_9NEIS|nr:anthranilate phosphoribosyltransferase [Leeia speluncae]MCB6182176.1 anthranilate phosphoribosyltransferase [Leeia speluncae]
MITPQEALVRVIENREIFHDEMLHLMRMIMQGEMSPTVMAGLIVGLRVKKETVGEITAAAEVMREFATKVTVANHDRLVDIVGTGGDASHTFNISTSSMFVAAAAGARVAKHGGRSVSSSSGSADVLEALGVNLALTPAQVAECIDKTGIGFMFAPNHHSAMKHAAPVRKELGVRTLFNILGPLTNPAGAKNQLLGVFHPDLVGILVRVLQRLGSDHVLVVHGKPQDGGTIGLDEITLTGESLVGELVNGQVKEYTLHPEMLGLPVYKLEQFRVGNPAESQARLLAALEGTDIPARDIVLANAGAALVSAGVADSLVAGVALAREAIASGAARAKLDEFVQFTKQFA